MKSIIIKLLSSILATSISLSLWFLLILTLKLSKIGSLQSIAVLVSQLSYLGWLIFGALCIALNILFFKFVDTVYIQNLVKKGGSNVAFTFLLLGMLSGIVGFGPLFFLIDKTRGWNPYGWWFPVTLIAAVLSGLTAFVIYGQISNKANQQTEIKE